MQHKPLTSQEKVLCFEIPPNCIPPSLGWVFGKMVSLSFLPMFILSLLSFVMEPCLSSCLIFSRGDYSICSCIFVVPGGGSEVMI